MGEEKIDFIDPVDPFAVFTNPTHYGNPTGGCMDDETEAKIQGLKGDACIPKCTGGVFKKTCPTDVPDGTTAAPSCILKDTKGDHYCILVCSGTATGDCPTGATCETIQGEGVCMYESTHELAGQIVKAGDVTVSKKFADDMNSVVPEYVIEAFSNWKVEHGKTYEGEEHEYRLRVFMDNLKFIEDFYKGPKETYTIGITGFTDLTHEEFLEQYVGGLIQDDREKIFVDEEIDMSALPSSVDWRTGGGVNAVKNQEQCGSCWAFSAVASMEFAYWKSSGTLKSFSEQQLVDCSAAEGNHGCNGGLMDYAFTYAKTHLMDQESDYEYKAKKSFFCHAKDYTGVAEVKSFQDVKPDSVAALSQAASERVVSIAIEADKAVFQHYTGGVITSSACGKKLDHGVAVVGYTADAFIVRNSWGPTWGENGYVRIARSSENVCGILSQPSYPTM